MCLNYATEIEEINLNESRKHQFIKEEKLCSPHTQIDLLILL